MSNDPIERSRLAWLGARYRFERLLKGEPSEEEYRKAKTDLEQAKQRYDELAPWEAKRQRPGGVAPTLAAVQPTLPRPAQSQER